MGFFYTQRGNATSAAVSLHDEVQRLAQAPRKADEAGGAAPQLAPEHLEESRPMSKQVGGYAPRAARYSQAIRHEELRSQIVTACPFCCLHGRCPGHSAAGRPACRAFQSQCAPKVGGCPEGRCPRDPPASATANVVRRAQPEKQRPLLLWLDVAHS